MRKETPVSRETCSMWLEMGTRLGGLVSGPGVLGATAAGCVTALLAQHRRLRGERRRARRTHSELMAYMLLDDWKVKDAHGMGRRICRAVSRHSGCGRGAALLVRTPGGRLQIVASQRSDDLTRQALERWAETEEVQERHRRDEATTRGMAGAAPAAELVRLERRLRVKPGDPAALAWCSALIVPMCNRRGHVTGAIAVCADPLLGKSSAVLQDALSSLEALADRFAEGVAGLGEHERRERPAGARPAAMRKTATLSQSVSG